MVKNITQNYRFKADLTIRAFAEQVGVSFQAVSAWENGLYRPGQNRLLRIWSNCSDWRRDWAAECLSEYYPDTWKLICQSLAPA